MSTYDNVRPFPASGPLQVVVLPGRLPLGASQEMAEYHQATYKLWHSTWVQTLKELDGLTSLPSDHFTRQDIVLTLFKGKECIAITCFRRANLADPVDFEDSWFQPWPEATRVDLGAKYPYGLANSWLTIHPDHRKSRNDSAETIDVSYLLCEVFNYTVLETGADIVYGVTRNNRSVNKLAHYGGAVSLLENQKHHGVPVDLVVFLPEAMRKAQVHFSALAPILWRQKKLFVSLSPNQETYRATGS